MTSILFHIIKQPSRCFGLLDICTGMIPFEGDPDASHGGVTGRVNQDLYQAWLPQIMTPNRILMHDNAPFIEHISYALY